MSDGLHILHVIEGHYLPDAIGGVVLSMHPESRLLTERGHRSTVLAVRENSLAQRAMRRALLLAGFPRRLTVAAGRTLTFADDRLGYPVLRVPQFVLAHALEDTVAMLKADVVVFESRHNAMLPSVESLRARGVPVVCRLWSQVPIPPQALPDVPYIVLSQASAAWYRTQGVRDPLILPPVILPEDYRVESERKSVVSIGVVAAKGFDLMIEVAALCPEIPFEVYASWGKTPEDLMTRARALPNMRMNPPTHDMKAVYRKARILAAPSLMETWGRTVTEAQFSGIPAIARDVGALREAVAGGGIMMPPDADAKAWAVELRRLWNDGALYADLSRRALGAANRPEIAPDRSVDRLLDALRAEIARRA